MNSVVRLVSGSVRTSRLWRAAVTACCVAVLAACGTTSNDGAYYQNDGPGDRSPSEFLNVADPVPRDEPVFRPSLRPYRVFDRQYVPLTERQPFRQSGVASWYGRQFQGKPTAIGEPYDMYKLTAAHPTLPLPSYVRVRNLDNNRTVVVRVNDRGPFSNGRIIDLSYAAAAKLGYIERGTTLVSIEVVDPVVTAMEKNGTQPVVPTVRLSTRPAHTVRPDPTIPAAQASLPVPAFTLARPQPVGAAQAGAGAAGAVASGGRRAGAGRPAPAPAPSMEVIPVTVVGGQDSTVGVRVETLQAAGLRPAIPESDRVRQNTQRDPLQPRDWRTPEQRAESHQIDEISAEARRVELDERERLSAKPDIYLQFGAYSTEKAAREDLYRNSGSFNSLYLPVEIVVERGLHKIQAGPFESELQAEAAVKRFRAETSLRPFYVFR